MDVQTALDAPRMIYLNDRNECGFEVGISYGIIEELANKGHIIAEINDTYSQIFGGGQIIMIDPSTNVLIAGSDPRKDGCAIGVWQ